MDAIERIKEVLLVLKKYHSFHNKSTIIISRSFEHELKKLLSSYIGNGDNQLSGKIKNILGLCLRVDNELKEDFIII